MPPNEKKAKNEDELRSITVGIGEDFGCDNSVRTSKYTLLNFLPIAFSEQFRRVGNIFFLCMGFLMLIGAYTNLFETAVSPFTTLGPLAIVLLISFVQEGVTDLRRHRADRLTNMYKCVVMYDAFAAQGLEKAETLLNGEDVVVENDSGIDTNSPRTTISYNICKRADIMVGNFVLVRNREMVPADMVLLASSVDGGSAYIETSSIDGETNLKLRTCPNYASAGSEYKVPKSETLEMATKRLTRLSVLGVPEGLPATSNSLNNPPEEHRRSAFQNDKSKRDSLYGASKRTLNAAIGNFERILKGRPKSVPRQMVAGSGYVMMLNSEQPNASVNTFSGKLTLPPQQNDGASPTIPLDADNLLLRGAVLRNTEWAIGVVVFTGRDTKLVQNSLKTPSKFSQLDLLINRTIKFILLIMFIVVLLLSGLATLTQNSMADDLWYVGINPTNMTWPYLPDLPMPQWNAEPPLFGSHFFTFFTLLNNFIPLSMYVTVEVATFFMMVIINSDLSMYHEETDTAAMARSTIVTDLGQVQYVFSDKTGTLTQNVMKFKRCSVDGIAFGSPVDKNAPKPDDMSGVDGNRSSPFLPLKNLLTSQKSSNTLTFNTEMFLRVMALCHTVVVEKDFDSTSDIPQDKSDSSSVLKKVSLGLFKGKTGRKSTGEGVVVAKKEQSIIPRADTSTINGKVPASSKSSVPSTNLDDQTIMPHEKGPNGAPKGQSYQAESPDEGALVGAASELYDYQLVSRDSSGICIRTSTPSILENPDTVEGIRNGSVTMMNLASGKKDNGLGDVTTFGASTSAPREECWNILAINKFDSDRKRMSILLRSPPELGSLPILFCKGADSSMLKDDVCSIQENMISDPISASMSNDSFEVEMGNKWETEVMLGMTEHLGEFSREGLRILVLGMKILSEEECGKWLKIYTDASNAIFDRSQKLKDAALDIETGLHIVGVTAIEDKLQQGVPETIASLSHAGIKLWVLTGDKRETAIEIGYSTKVLTPDMHLKQLVGEGGEAVAQASLALEFMKLVKSGKLAQYQMASLEESRKFRLRWLLGWRRSLGRFRRRVWRVLKRWARGTWNFLTGKKNSEIETELQASSSDVGTLAGEEELGQNRVIDPGARRRRVRALADSLIAEFKKRNDVFIENGISSESPLMPSIAQAPSPATPVSSADKSLNSSGVIANINRMDPKEKEALLAGLDDDAPPDVFRKADAARRASAMIKSCTSQPPSTSIRQYDIASSIRDGNGNLTEEETLSMISLSPDLDLYNNEFDKGKRTALERLFAVDRDVRHGRLQKHVKDDLLTIIEEPTHQQKKPIASNKPRALVIEGSALSYLLGDPLLEEMLFAVANRCDSVIACRVSPKQKALLVRLVRSYVSPTPVTLAIGDGANDVGMIQEAHVGVGISGLEGQQAVNASDFSIAQFRFLKELLLIHGRWNFIRMSITVLFSFYKNALLAGFLAIYSARTLYSGTPVFDQWVISMFNFVAAFPIVFFSFFDRSLEKDYIMKHPEVYASTMNNEYIKNRNVIRWITICFVHICVGWVLCGPALSGSGGNSPGFKGLMVRNDRAWPGDGEGGDLKSFGTVIYTVMIILLGYKALFESRSIIIGSFPYCTCSKRKGEGFANRIPYTFIGFIILSFLFWLFGSYMYSLVGRTTKSTDFGNYTDVAMHVFDRRSLTWMLALMAPIAAAMCDVAGKLFANMFFPTQTQIHLEIAQKEKQEEIAQLRIQERRQTADLDLEDGQPIFMDAVNESEQGIEMR